MKINDVIRTRRQALGLTQEALAGKLGVSAPAVNKWERGLNYPDITLLPVLARTLGVDLNTLLSFQEDLGWEEVNAFLAELSETARDRGGEAMFRMAQEKLREFPNNDHLAFGVAGMLSGVLTLFPGEAEEKRAAWEREMFTLYERCARSGEPGIQSLSAYALAAHCITKGELDRAEELLQRLPDTHREKGLVTANLRKQQGRQEEAWALLERELFDRASGAQSVLIQMQVMAQSEGDAARARALLEAVRGAGRAFHLPEYTAASAALLLALAEEDGPQVLTGLEGMLEGLTQPWALEDSPLYRHLPPREETGEARQMLLRRTLDQMETDPELAFLRGLPEYQALLERFRAQPTSRQPSSAETSTFSPRN